MVGSIMEKNKGAHWVLICFCTPTSIALLLPAGVLDRAIEHEEGTSDKESDGPEEGKRRATA